VATQVEIYRAKARQCERLAARASDGHIRNKLLALAASWRRMADQAEASAKDAA
jgi:hypothetical protein